MIFKDFLKRGLVRKGTPKPIDKRRILDSYKKRYVFIKSIPLNKDNAIYIIENCYDVVRELIEALLEKEGYKSYSHEATIFYLKKFDSIKDNEISFLDNLRKVRNKIKYEREDQSIESAKKVMIFIDKIIPKLVRLIK